MRRKLPLLSAIVLVSALAGAQRLPENIIPEHYQLTFTPDLQNAKFTGEETIDVRILTSAHSVTLNAVDLSFQETEIIVHDQTLKAQVSLEPTREQITLTVPDQLQPGTARIHIKFSGVLNNQLRGFYMSKSRSLKFAFTHFESTYARRAFPCFDEPAFKARFDVTLVLPKNETGISNGRVVADTDGPGNWHTIVFSTTARMSSYLVAVAVGKLECAEDQADGIPIRVCGQPAWKSSFKSVLGYAKEIVGFLDRYHEIKYPFGKLDIVGVPDLEPTGMENAGAIFCRENIFVDEKGTSFETHKNTFSILAHEIAHQWFGNLVTMRWWDDLWLNEGFATWMANKVIQEVHPEWDSSNDAALQNDAALSADALKNTHPLRTAVETPDEIYSLFDPIPYLKGAAILRMLESSLGPELFRKGVNAYLRKYSYKNATAEDFWQTMTEVCAMPVERMMAAFVRQAGEPLVSIETACKNGKTEVTLSQQRFWQDPKAATSSDNEIWTIPLCLKAGTDKPSCQLFSKRQQTVMLDGCATWVFAHPSGGGYYRAAYQPANLKKLISAMAGFTSAERLSLLGDTWALAEAGQESVADYLDLVAALHRGTDPDVMASYKGALFAIHDDRLAVSDREGFQSWIRTNFKPLLVEINGRSSENQNESLTRLRADLIEILGQLGEDQEVIKECQRLIEKYLTDPSSLDARTARSVSRVAAYFGDEALFKKFAERIRSYRSVEQYFNLTIAMSEFRAPDLAQRWLETCSSQRNSSSDLVYCITSLFYSSANRQLTWEWVKKQWPTVEAKLTATSGTEIIGAAGNFCDPALRDDVRQFFATHKIFSAERLLQQSLERIDSCIRIRNQQQGAVSAWLRKSRPE